jgi:hypothetical protein
MKAPSYDLREAPHDAVVALVQRCHGYGSAGRLSVYSFGVYERGDLVAGWLWQPPPPGAARAVAPGAPAGALALSRMVAVPRHERRLRHISRPLRRQMRVLIDRTRWPVLVTYHDHGQGHSGHVYKCSGWQRDGNRMVKYAEREDGSRVSTYSAGAPSGATVAGTTTLTRWVHRVCPKGQEQEWMAAHGWRREPVPGKHWRSGAQAMTWTRQGALL